MALSREDLQAQLLEFRKASRLMMWFYDCSDKLWESIDSALEAMDEIKIKETEELPNEDYDRPKEVSFEAFESISNGSNLWMISCFSEENRKAKLNSFLMNIALHVDYWPRNDPKDSFSGLEIWAYHVKHINGKATDVYDDLEPDEFDAKGIGENAIIDSDGDILKPGKLTIFPNIWSVKKYSGDYAAGLYDLSDLIDEDTVKNTVIADIRNLVEGWSK